MKITYLLAALLLVSRDANGGSGAKPQKCRSNQAQCVSYTMEKLSD